MIDGNIRAAALEKLAYFGRSDVSGSPAFMTPPMTVGQVMYNAGSPAFGLHPDVARGINNSIVRSGLSVNDPAKKLFHAGIGALASNFIANKLGVGPFARGVITAAGANYGYNH